MRSTLDGVGTGAGVAWPLFGIITSSLGIAAGSTIALATGSVASLLFCGICCGTFLISYQNALKQNSMASEKVTKYVNKLNAQIHQLLEDGYQRYLAHSQLHSKAVDPEEALQFMLGWIKFKIKKSKSPTPLHSPYLLNLLEDLIEQEKSNKLLSAFIMHKITNEEDQALERLCIKNLVNKLVLDIPLSPLPFSSSFKTGFVAFAGAFGSIAGCSAGFMGLLSGLGVISGFAALPVLGVSILGVALALAILVAAQAIRNTAELHKLNSLKSSIKLICNDLNEFHKDFDIQSRAELIAAKASDPHHQPVFHHRFSSSNDMSDDECDEERTHRSAFT